MTRQEIEQKMDELAREFFRLSRCRSTSLCRCEGRASRHSCCLVARRRLDLGGFY